MKEGSGGGGEVSGWFTKEMKLGYYVLYILQLKKKKKTQHHTHTKWLQPDAVFYVGKGQLFHYGQAENNGNGLRSESEDQWFPDLIAMWVDNLLNIS